MAQGTIVTSVREIPGPTCPIRCFVARPEGAAPLPVVVVIQEWWGLNDHIREVASRFAAEGYVAVAPDLYSRLGNEVTADPNEAGRLMGSLAKADGLADLLAVVAHLRDDSGVRGDRIGVVGFCMGGSYASLLACRSGDLRAAAAFYGEVPEEADLVRLQAPLLYLWGSEDFWIQRPEVERLAEALSNHGKPGEVKIYEGAPHAFFNDTRADVFRPKEAADAWDRVKRLFADRLQA